LINLSEVRMLEAVLTSRSRWAGNF